MRRFQFYFKTSMRTFELFIFICKTLLPNGLKIITPADLEDYEG